MEITYFLNAANAVRFVHLLAAVTWIGGMIFVAFVLEPVLRKTAPEQRMQLYDAVGRRFLYVGWGTLAVLIATGILNAINQIHSWEVLFYSTYGNVLLLKLSLVLAMLLISAYHSFILGPAMVSVDKKDEKYLSLSKRQIFLSGLNLTAGVLILMLAIILMM